MSRSERKKKKKTERNHLSKYKRKLLDRQHSGEAEAAVSFEREQRKAYEKRIKHGLVPKEHQVMDPY